MAVDSVVSFLLDNVTQLLKQEATLLPGVGGQVRSLHNELKLINQFLENSVGKRDMLKDLENQIRDVAHQAEDIIDTFVINMAKNNRRNMLGKALHNFEHAAMLRTVAKDIESISAEITKIYSKKEKYQIENKESSDGDSNRRSEQT